LSRPAKIDGYAQPVSIEAIRQLIREVLAPAVIERNSKPVENKQDSVLCLMEGVATEVAGNPPAKEHAR
jgi:hypothetical protein